MTRKDFQLIADVIADCEKFESAFSTKVLTAQDLCDRFTARLASENPRFDRGKFQKAALPLWSAEHTARVKSKIILDGFTPELEDAFRNKLAEI